ncbi:MAG: glycosyltransferase family 4 protein [Planctomycetes bacterium]|nr:glycosyltransferase family 4 protein [Planctomycetota bacterium]
MSAPTTIFVDARMIDASGIGRTIRCHLAGLAGNPYRFVAGVADERGAAAVRGLHPEIETVAYEAPIYSFREHWLGWRLARRLRARVDLFWFPHYNVPWMMPANSVVTIHDLIHLKFPRTSGNPLKVEAARGVIRRALSRARRVACDSATTLEDVVAFEPEARRKVRVVPAGVTRAWRPYTAEAQAEFRRRVGLSRFLLALGNKKWHKNHRMLLQALDLLGPGDDAPRLVIIGRREPGWEATVAEWRARGGAFDRLVDLEDVSDEDLAGYYASAEAFLMPSFYEGFGIPPLEAMSAGTPVISSGCGALAETVGDAGLTRDPLDARAWADAVLLLRRDQSLRRTLIERGLAHVERFSWSTASALLAAVFQEAIEGVERP